MGAESVQGGGDTYFALQVERYHLLLGAADAHEGTYLRLILGRTLI